MERHEPEQQSHDALEAQRERPAVGGEQTSLPATPQVPQEPHIPAPAPTPEDSSAGVTLVHAPTFHVRAFASRVQTEVQPGAGSSFLKKIGWASAERTRLAEEETHALPHVETASARQHRGIPLPTWLEAAVVALFLGASLVMQALSLFTYPAYTTDEGNYMANAWAVLQGRMVPYTFTYAHPPLGWIQIATWTDLTGGITGFGNAINSGRVLMLVLALTSSLLLYLITKWLSGSRSAALLALIIYTLSPLSLLYRHEVLLDNIGTFWLLLSLCLIVHGKSRLSTLAMAAVALSIAILSKGVFLVFLPVMLYAVWLHATRFQRKFSLVAFLYTVLAFISLYALFALLKGELVPAGVPLGSTQPHPSLLATLLQTFQGPGSQAQFRQSWNTWMQLDPLLLTAGMLAVFINLLAGIVNRFQLLVALFALTFCFFLLISGTVYGFAIVPLLPLLALNITLALNNALRWLTRGVRFDLARALLIFALIGVLIPTGLREAWSLAAHDQTAPQQQAMWWIGDNVPRDAVVITNSYLYTDLHDPQGLGVSNLAPFPHAQIYSDAALDPAIANGELKQDWRRINFLVVDSSMLQNIRSDKRYFLLNQALHHAALRAIFGSLTSGGMLIEVYQVLSG